MNNQALLEAIDVRQYFTVKKERGGSQSLRAVDGVTLSIQTGESYGLVGESGCGKSTLGRTLLRLYPLTGGKIIFDGQDISRLRGKALKAFRRESQMIFQDPSSSLNPRRTIVDILKEPFAVHRQLEAGERQSRILDLCDMVGLSESYLGRYPHELSGGQKQRVGIARALALNPRLLVCDEPVSALDVSIQAQVINLLQDLQEQLDLTYLFISHDLSVVKHSCHRIGVMYLGKIVEEAAADRLYERAGHPYTQALISAIPTLDDGREEIAREARALTGDLPSPTAIPRGCAFHTRCPQAMDRCRLEQPCPTELEPGHLVSCHLYQ